MGLLDMTDEQKKRAVGSIVDNATGTIAAPAQVTGQYDKQIADIKQFEAPAQLDAKKYDMSPGGSGHAQLFADLAVKAANERLYKTNLGVAESGRNAAIGADSAANVAMINSVTNKATTATSAISHADTANKSLEGTQYTADKHKESTVYNADSAAKTAANRLEAEKPVLAAQAHKETKLGNLYGEQATGQNLENKVAPTLLNQRVKLGEQDITNNDISIGMNRDTASLHGAEIKKRLDGMSTPSPTAAPSQSVVIPASRTTEIANNIPVGTFSKPTIINTHSRYTKNSTRANPIAVARPGSR